jgi:hypothetical protein
VIAVRGPLAEDNGQAPAGKPLVTTCPGAVKKKSRGPGVKEPEKGREQREGSPDPEVTENCLRGNLERMKAKKQGGIEGSHDWLEVAVIIRVRGICIGHPNDEAENSRK